MNANKEKNNVVSYKVTRQLKEALIKCAEQVAVSEKNVIETQDLLLSLVSTPDTGAAYALGRSSITTSKLTNEIEHAITVEERTALVEPSEDDYGNYSFKKKLRKAIETTPVRFIKEGSTGFVMPYNKQVEISTHVYAALEFAEELRIQKSPDAAIDSYWLLVYFVQNIESNAYELINKQMLVSGSAYDGEKLHESFTFKLSRFDFRDGRNEEDRRQENIKQSKIYSKLENPDYSILEDISIDLTAKAKEKLLMPVIGRDHEIKQMEIALTRRDKNNIALLGKGGVGKSAIVDGLAIKIVDGEIPSLANKRILQFSLHDLLSVISGDTIRGILRFIEEMKRQQDIILFMDEFHMLGRMKSLTDALKPIMARGDFRFIGATTNEEWNTYIAPDSALIRRFEQITVKSPSIEDTIKIVSGVINAYENFHKINIDKEMVELAVKSAQLFLKKDQLPDSAFTLLDNACAIKQLKTEHPVKIQNTYDNKLKALKKSLEKAKLKEFNEEEVDSIREKINHLVKEQQKKRNQLKKNDYRVKLEESDIYEAIEYKVGDKFDKNLLLSEEEINALEFSKLHKLKSNLERKVIGQNEAIEALTDAIILEKSGFTRSDKPVGVFLFVGTTGVGKTETAKALAEELYGSAEHMIRFDMSEYQHSHEVAKLIGAPPGYIGHQNGGILTNAVKENPKTIILFDEIEKADVRIYDILLQVFDDARLTDSSGETVDFSQTIIIMTSNLGANEIRKEKVMGFDTSDKRESQKCVIKQHTQQAIVNHFRPEFLNRIDEIITFNPFDKQAIYQITENLVNKEKSLIEEQGYKVIVMDGVVQHLADLYYDHKNGARPIKRGISKSIGTQLAKLRMTGMLRPNRNIYLDIKEEKLEIIC